MQQTVRKNDDSHLPRDPQEEDEIDLMEYVFVFWRRRWIILAATVLGGVVAFGASKLSPRTYESSVKLLVTPGKTSETGDFAPVVSIATFRAMVDNQSLAAQVVNEFRLDQPPLYMTPERFLSEALTVEAVRDTNVVVVTVRLANKELPAKVANRLAALSVDLAARLSQDETVRARDVIKSQLDETRARLDRAQTQLEEYQKASQIDLLKRDVESLLAQRGDLVDLTVQIGAERARLAQAEKELVKQPEVRESRRSVEFGPAFPPAPPARGAETGRRLPVEAGRTAAGTVEGLPHGSRRLAPGSPAVPSDSTRPSSDLGRPGSDSSRAGSPEDRKESRAGAAREAEAQFRDESVSPYINPVYEILQQQVATSRTRVAALEQQRAEMVGSLKLGGSQLAKLSELYTKQMELARLETEHDLARTVYTEVATRFEQARLQVAGRSAQLQVMDSALTGARHVGPKVVRNTAVGVAFGFAASAIAALFCAAVASAAARRPRDKHSLRPDIRA